jgi:Spy/CpxP family protein refolding chaperone
VTLRVGAVSREQSNSMREASTMRSMIRVGVAALALLVAANAAEAQGGGGGGGGGMGGRGGDPAAAIQRQTDALMQGITLDDAQKAKVDTISKKMVADQAKMREQMAAGGDRQAMMGQMQELTTKFRTELRGVLTDEQKAKFDENIKNMPAGRGRGGF